jgi:NhaC family Na+:H+ antiporter
MNTPRRATFVHAIIPVGITAVMLLVASIKLNVTMHVPMVIGTICAALMAMWLGYPWKDIQAMMVGGVQTIVAVLFILMLAGTVMGVWIISGTVPAMIFYGLKILTPKTFLALSFLICAVVSTSMGTAFGTTSTVGIAMMGIGTALGLPAPMVAGAIVSGVYFGDRLSPLGSALNLSSAVTGSEIYATMKHLLATTIPATLISVVVYALMGQKVANVGAVNQADAYLQFLAQHFNLNLWLLLPPLLVVVLAACRVPAIPSLTAGAVLGAIWAWLFQHASVAAIFSAMHHGYVSQTGVTTMDSLLSRGGLTGMADVLSLLTISMAFSGILENTGALHALVKRPLEWVKTIPQAIVATAVLSTLIAAVAANQSLALIVSGRLFKPLFDKFNLDSKNLARCLLDSAGLICPLIPWNLNALFMTGMLGVSAGAYLPYSLFTWLVPITTVLFGVFDFNLQRQTESQMAA